MFYTQQPIRIASVSKNKVINVTIPLPSLHTSHRSRRCPLPVVLPSHTVPGSPAGWRSSLSHSMQRILLHVHNGEDNLGKFSGLRKLLEISSWIWDPYPLSENSQIISNVFGCICSETLIANHLSHIIDRKHRQCLTNLEMKLHSREFVEFILVA